MHTDEIRSLDDVAIVNLIEDIHKQLFELRVQVVARKVQNTSQIRNLKRDVARLLTIQREREFEQALLEQ